MAPPKDHSTATHHLCFFLLHLFTATISFAGVSALDSSICAIPSAAPERLGAGEDTQALLHSFQLGAGYFFGGEDIHFAKDESDGSVYHVSRTLKLVPLQIERTTNASVFYVAATLTLTGGLADDAVPAHRRQERHLGSLYVSFYLHGYYNSTSAELCMVGSGTYSVDGGALKHLRDVVAGLRVPSPPTLSDPFVTGRLKGSSFDVISLVAYAEGDDYTYGESASCPPPPPLSSTARGARQALGGAFSCAHLKEHLVSSYKLQYGGRGDGGGAHASASSPALLRLQEPRMHVGRVGCSEDGAVRVYTAFSNNTNMFLVELLQPGFMVREEAIVAEGRWDPDRSMLCLRACRVVRAGPTSLAVQEQDCSIRMSFWFPGVWTIRDRSVISGTLWDSSQAAAAGEVSVSSIGSDNRRGNFSDVKYHYTMVQEAEKHYLTAMSTSANRKSGNKAKGSFPAANYAYHDFEFRFYMDNDPGSGYGDAHPVTLGSALVYGDRLAAEDLASRHGMAVAGMEHELLNISYDIRIHELHPRVNLMERPENRTFPQNVEEWQITAEGVYDPKTGVLCMIGCREHDGSADCQILVTVLFASLDAKAQGHGKGVISSLRNKTTDPLFFERMDISLFGMYAEQASEAVSRMDLESVMLVISTTLPCVFTALQILHAKRRPEAAAATSITMLVVVALGYVAPLVLSSEALFASRRTQYVPFVGYLPYELNQMMLRVPTLIAFVLQLRLLQLALSGRRSAADRSKAEASSAGERRALWVCLPLYLLGGALTVLLHTINGRRAAQADSLTVRVGPEPVTLWEDLASSAGLALDAFLLPQVAMNAFAGARARALSPWFYVGGTVVRAAPHVYDAIRAQGYVPSVRPSYVYASPPDDRFGLAWDVAVPCGAALLAVVLFLQQRP